MSLCPKEVQSSWPAGLSAILSSTQNESLKKRFHKNKKRFSRIIKLEKSDFLSTNSEFSSENFFDFITNCQRVVYGFLWTKTVTMEASYSISDAFWKDTSERHCSKQKTQNIFWYALHVLSIAYSVHQHASPIECDTEKSKWKKLFVKSLTPTLVFSFHIFCTLPLLMRSFCDAIVAVEYRARGYPHPNVSHSKPINIHRLYFVAKRDLLLLLFLYSPFIFDDCSRFFWFRIVNNEKRWRGGEKTEMKSCWRTTWAQNN